MRMNNGVAANWARTITCIGVKLFLSWLLAASFSMAAHAQPTNPAAVTEASDATLSSTLTASSDEPTAGVDVVLQALANLGAPYKYGGENPATGFDCSGFVRHVFGGVTGLDLPRNSQAIARVGQRVKLKDLLPGDLVFFNTRGKPFSHVGIYIGDDRFVHAPAKRGQVRIEAIDNRYWRARFNGARRLLQEEGKQQEGEQAAATTSNQTITPTPSPSPNSGDGYLHGS